ncbi:MAG TPA: phosphatase PAP2 family protein [Opitutaceae bacterium]|jgi:acid phosphatase (class A)|nr:phosphatase PAP2 family protein [Opitutaceae bacterium]
MKTRLLFLTLPLLAFFAASLHAAETKPKYLSGGQPDAIVLLPPPPVAGSAEDAADLETTFRVYRAATPAERAHGIDEINLTVFHFATVIGPWFTPGKFPKTEALFKEVEAETKAVTSHAKKYWQRIRPYHVDPARFPNAIEHEAVTDYSYPSGHSTRATVFARVLAELFPDKRDALLSLSRDIGWHRVLGGVHYPTDIYAGRVLGQAIVRELLANPAFQRDLAEAKTELAAAQH